MASAHSPSPANAPNPITLAPLRAKKSGGTGRLVLGVFGEEGCESSADGAGVGDGHPTEMIWSFSRAGTMTLRDNTSGEVLHGAGVIDAARRLIVAGHSVDLGAWQINSRNLSLLGLGVADAFEPCKAVSAAAAAPRPSEMSATKSRAWRSFTAPSAHRGEQLV